MRTRSWMYLEWKLRDAGYTVANISYPSLFYPVQELATIAI